MAGPVSGRHALRARRRGEFDAVIACYHDQGLIPIKLLAFGTAVNVTLGLPIIRTSVDHGTAFDIAGRGCADRGSLVRAIRLAARLAEPRHGRHVVAEAGRDGKDDHQKEERRKAERIIAENRKAHHDYSPDGDVRGGRGAVGTEVKAIREGRVTCATATPA